MLIGRHQLENINIGSYIGIDKIGGKESKNLAND